MSLRQVEFYGTPYNQWFYFLENRDANPYHWTFHMDARAYGSFGSLEEAQNHLFVESGLEEDVTVVSYSRGAMTLFDLQEQELIEELLTTTTRSRAV
jgi:hypothetical protein